jgi:hypothetical protein
MIERPATPMPEPTLSKIIMPDPPASYIEGRKLVQAILESCEHNYCHGCPGTKDESRIERYVNRLINKLVTVQCVCSCHTEI